MFRLTSTTDTAIEQASQAFEFRGVAGGRIEIVATESSKKLFNKRAKSNFVCGVISREDALRLAAELTAMTADFA
jgi:hypothetical protein